MTAPDQSSPPGSEATGLFAAHQARTEEDAKSAMKEGVITSGTTAQTNFDNEIKAPLNGVADSVDNHEVRIVALENGGTMTVYSGNGTWTNLGGRIGVAVTNGGQAGQNGQGNDGVQRLGGSHGGYVYREFDCSSLPATVAITIGAPGSTEAQGGGISSFGTFLVGVSGTGGVQTRRGALATTSMPGSGGNNGGGLTNSAGFPGGSSALAAGGAGGAGSGGYVADPGGAGGSVDTGSFTPCGGGGGGAGGGSSTTSGYGGNGGNGGSPGGGGGAGGNAQAGHFGIHGAGGTGRVWVIQLVVA